MPQSRRVPFLVLFLLLIVAAVLGGLGARMLPTQSDSSPAPALVTGSTDLPSLVRKTAPAVVNIAVLQPSPADQNVPRGSVCCVNWGWIVTGAVCVVVFSGGGVGPVSDGLFTFQNGSP